MRSVLSMMFAVLLLAATPAYAYYEYNRTVYKLQTSRGSYYSYPIHNSYVPRVRYPTAQYIDVQPQYRYSYAPTYQPYTPPRYHGSAGGTCLHYLTTGECAIEQWNPRRSSRRSYDDDDDYIIYYNDDDDYYDYDDDDYDDDE